MLQNTAAAGGSNNYNTVQMSRNSSRTLDQNYFAQDNNMLGSGSMRYQNTQRVMQHHGQDGGVYYSGQDHSLLELAVIQLAHLHQLSANSVRRNQLSCQASVALFLL